MLAGKSEDFEASFGKKMPDREADAVIFSCQRGGRSTKASDAAVELGYKKVFNYVGGASDWFST